MSAAKLLSIALICLAAAILTGCGKLELKTAGQASDFIRDIARGGSVDDWTHEADAVASADNAWLYQGEIESLGKTLREKGPDWACNTADNADTASEVSGIYTKLSEEDRERILFEAELEGAARPQAESLISDILKLGKLRAFKA